MAVEWLDGKLPMPTLKEIFKANILNRTPKSGKAAMVHDSFFYPRHNGSQHIVERLAEGIDIFTGTQVKRIEKNENGDLLVNKTYSARCIIYTGDIRFLPDALDGGTMSDSLISRLRALKSHGTTNILYQCVPSKISWTYIPSPRHKAHRIINTGLFAESNTSGEIRERGSSTSVLEFSGFVSREEVLNEARGIPGFQRMLGYNYKESTYIIQEHGTRQVVSEAKRSLEKFKIFLVGRFAEWEYYNMDTAIEASLQCAYYAAYALDNKHVSG